MGAQNSLETKTYDGEERWDWELAQSGELRKKKVPLRSNQYSSTQVLYNSIDGLQKPAMFPSKINTPTRPRPEGNCLKAASPCRECNEQMYIYF